jgi:hypothetical protein
MHCHLLQLWKHLITLDGSAGSGSTHVSITTKIKPFMLFMVLTCICGLAAAVLQVFKSATLLSMDLSIATDATVYFLARSGSFDMFAPVTIICFVLAFYYSWKKPSSKPKVTRASSLRSGRTSTLNSSQLIAAAASLNSNAGEGYDSSASINEVGVSEKLEDEPRAGDGALSSASETAAATAAAIAAPTLSASASIADDTTVIVVGNSSD